MILVAGATGVLGGEICRRLLERGRPVRALVRASSDPGRVERAREAGADIVTGDFKDPSSLAHACEGVSAVISGVTAVLPRQQEDSIEAVDRNGHLALIDAAETAQVQQFVFVSYSGNMSTPCPLTDAKRAVERRLMDSELTYTILRPSVFMESWLSGMVGFDPLGGRVRVVGTGDQKLSWISVGDVAEFAVRCLDEPEAANQVIELGGPEELSPLEVVKMAEEIGNHSIEIERVPLEAVQQQRAQASNPTEESFSTLMIDQTGGDEIDMSSTVQRFPVELVAVREYLTSVFEGHPTYPPQGQAAAGN